MCVNISFPFIILKRGVKGKTSMYTCYLCTKTYTGRRLRTKECLGSFIHIIIWPQSTVHNPSIRRRPLSRRFIHDMLNIALLTDQRKPLRRYMIICFLTDRKRLPSGDGFLQCKTLISKGIGLRARRYGGRTDASPHELPMFHWNKKAKAFPCLFGYLLAVCQCPSNPRGIHSLRP